MRVTRSFVSIGAVCAAQILTSCSSTLPQLAPSVAQPNTRVSRAFTSFSEPLRCMDRLLSTLPKRSYLISSSDIPDRTNGVRVGADDMLINAINQINRSNGRYVFLDQARRSDFGQFDLVTTRGEEDELHPSLYIRGSISQRDTDTVDDGAAAGVTRPNENRSQIRSGLFGVGRAISVISVDLHLVGYPSRRVIPGASVANSMVVVEAERRGSVVGVVEMTGLDVSVTIERIESEGQAVRNLVELGVIELLGRHSGVPYWTCLEHPSTDAKAAQRDERQVTRSSESKRVREAQEMLIDLGLLKGTPTGQLDAGTRQAISSFQARENLVPSGEADYDLIRRLEQRTGRRADPLQREPVQPAETAAASSPPAPKPAPPAPVPVRVTPVPAQPAPTPIDDARSECARLGGCDPEFKNLLDVIRDTME